MFRSNLHIYAQLIDDVNGVTVAAAASNGKERGPKLRREHQGAPRRSARSSPRRPRRRAHGGRVRPRALPVPRPHRRPGPRRHRGRPGLHRAGDEGKKEAAPRRDPKAKKAEGREEGQGKPAGRRRRKKEVKRLATLRRSVVAVDRRRTPTSTVAFDKRTRHMARDARRPGRARLARQRAGRFRRQDPPLRLRRQGRPAVQLQRPRRRRRQARAACRTATARPTKCRRPSRRPSRKARTTSTGRRRCRSAATPSRTASSASTAPAGSSWSRPGRAPALRPARASARCCRLAASRNILTKVHGSTNPINLVKATINGLLQLRTKEEVARLRGVATL